MISKSQEIKVTMPSANHCLVSYHQEGRIITMDEQRATLLTHLRYLYLVVVIALGLLTLIGSNGGGSNDASTGDQSGGVEIEWEIPTVTISYGYESGLLARLTFYMNFVVISGSGEVNITSRIKDEPESEDTLVEHTETFTVEEGTQYELSVQVNVGGEGLCSALDSDVLIFSSPSASSTEETYIYSTLHTDNNFYCIGTYVIDEMSLE